MLLPGNIFNLIRINGIICCCLKEDLLYLFPSCRQLKQAEIFDMEILEKSKTKKYGGFAFLMKI